MMHYIFLTLLITPTTLANFLAYQQMDFPFNVLSQTFSEEKNLIPTLCAALCMSQSYRCDGFFSKLKNCSLIDFDIQYSGTQNKSDVTGYVSLGFLRQQTQSTFLISSQDYFAWSSKVYQVLNINDSNYELVCQNICLNIERYYCDFFAAVPGSCFLGNFAINSIKLLTEKQTPANINVFNGKTNGTLKNTDWPQKMFKKINTNRYDSLAYICQALCLIDETCNIVSLVMNDCYLGNVNINQSSFVSNSTAIVYGSYAETWGGWSSWSNCTMNSCVFNGYQVRSRNCSSTYGGRYCVGPTFTCKSGCFDDGKDYSGNDILMTTNVTNAIKCQEMCQEKEDCKFFTFQPSNQNCWMKRAKSTLRTDSSFISGPKCC